MGFFSSFLSAYNGQQDPLEVYKDIEEDDVIVSHPNYRRRGLENTDSHYGWYTCVKCHKSFRKGDMDIDHIIPKSQGGNNSRYNLQCICKHCNRSKQDDMSETERDLRRRKRELDEQDKADRAFLREVSRRARREKKGRK